MLIACLAVNKFIAKQAIFFGRRNHRKLYLQNLVYSCLNFLPTQFSLQPHCFGNFRYFLIYCGANGAEGILLASSKAAPIL
jgi:hypothetical protein